MIKMLIHRQRPIIGLDQPQYQVKSGKLLTVKCSVFRIPAFTFTDTRQINQRHKTLAQLQPKTQRITGAGCDIADRGYITSKKGIAKATLSRSGFTQNTYHWLVVC